MPVTLTIPADIAQSIGDAAVMLLGNAGADISTEAMQSAPLGLERFREHFAALDGQRALLEAIGALRPATGVQVALDCLPALHAAVHKAEDEETDLFQRGVRAGASAEWREPREKVLDALVGFAVQLGSEHYAQIMREAGEDR